MSIELNNIYNVKIIGQENDGNGICKVDDMVVFVQSGLKGDEGDIKINEVKKNYARAAFINKNKLSNERVTPPCPYYGECGGCNLQHQGYDYQTKFKQTKVVQSLEHIGGLKNVKVEGIITDEEYSYRNKVSLKVEDNKIGFYKDKSNDLVDIEKCLLCDDKLNTVIKSLKEFVANHHDNKIKYITIRYSNFSDEVMISISGEKFDLTEELIAHITKSMNNIKSLVINDKTVYGNSFIIDEILGLKYKISALSFFQVNSKQTINIYNKVLEYCELSKSDNVLDLYCGTGTISLLLANKCKKVVGVEVVKEAIEDAKENALLNKVDNAEFVLGKVEYIIPKLLEEAIDVVVLDPPRNGSDNKTLEAITKINPKKIVYVSCNPITLARDLKYLTNNNYSLVEVTPIDMFPQTEHIECVAKLTRNI